MDIYNLYKGPFWIKCNFIAKENNHINVSFENAEILFYRVPDDLKTPSHKDCWNKVNSEVRMMPWNYYPRGRVEYTRNKAVIYANPIVFQYKNLEEELREAFNIATSIEVIYKNDNSSHYACYKNYFEKI